ncbi:phosphotyrosine protein phosphatase [Brevundimonas sp.]
MFAAWPEVETASAGLAPDADEPCTDELVEWADVIFVMERADCTRPQRRFRKSLESACVVCLDIPDDYGFMQPELVALLEKKVGPYLRSLSLWERVQGAIPINGRPDSPNDFNAWL